MTAFGRLACSPPQCIFPGVTPLGKTIKRIIKIQGDDFVVTLTPDALKVTRKGHQRGVEMRWESLVSGESALAVALQASVGKFDLQKADATRRVASTSAGFARNKPAKSPSHTKRPKRMPATKR